MELCNCGDCAQCGYADEEFLCQTCGSEVDEGDEQCLACIQEDRDLDGHLEAEEARLHRLNPNWADH